MKPLADLTDAEIVPRLKELQRVTDNILQRFKRDKDFLKDEPVNWGDLYCIEALYTLNQLGENSYQVLIEEGAPNANRFIVAIYEALEKEGWERVEIRVEW